MKARNALGTLVLLLALGALLAGCASSSGYKGDPYDDQRRAHEIEWNMDPWR